MNHRGVNYALSSQVTSTSLIYQTTQRYNACDGLQALERQRGADEERVLKTTS